VAKSENKKKAEASNKGSAAPIQNGDKSTIKMRPLGQSTAMTQRRRRRLNRKFLIGMAVWVVALAVSLYFLSR
jgi:hypothetical protein